MSFDIDAATQKLAEFTGLVADSIVECAADAGTAVSPTAAASQAEALTRQLLDRRILELRPPEAVGGVQLRMLTMADLGVGGARSRRPGHIRMNWRPLMESAVTLTLASASAADHPWMVPLVLIRTFSNLMTAMEVRISETEAMVAFVLWRARDPANQVHHDLLVAVNGHLSANGRSSISGQVLTASMTTLQRIGFIEIVSDAPWKWVLRDFAVIRYS